MFAQPSAAALNHLLMQNSWALQRLARFAGKTARFDIAPFSFAYTILDDGSLRSADAATSANALCVIAPSLLPRLVLHGARARNSLFADTKGRQSTNETTSHPTKQPAEELLAGHPKDGCQVVDYIQQAERRVDTADAKLSDENVHTEIRSEGDAGLLTEIFFLSRNLRWDAAEDLSVMTGDIAAERIMQIMHSTEQQLRDAVVNFSHAAAEYWTEERPLLAKPQQVSAFMQQVDTLRDDVARLEQRIGRLLSDRKI